MVSLVFCLCAVAHAGSWSSPQYSGGTATSGNGGGSRPYGGVVGGYGGNAPAGSGATATCAGTITAVFTWLPSGANDPPPAQVPVQETCTATAHGYGFMPTPTAAANTGLGKSATPTTFVHQSPPNSKTVNATITHTRIKKYAGGATLTVTCTPTASGTGQYTGSAGVVYSASISNVQILRDDAPIGDANNKCLPGEAINLTVGGGSAPFSWDITGDIFKDFDPTVLKTATNNKQYEDGDKVVKNQLLLTYRYIKGTGSAQKVSVTATINGSPVEVEDNIIAYQPNSVLYGQSGSPAISGLLLYLAPPGTGGYGMDWKGSSVTMSGYGNGVFGFAQTGTVARTVYDESNASYSLPASASTGLDLEFTYGGYEQSAGVVVGSDQYNGAGDNPSVGFFGSVQGAPPPGVSFSRVVLSDSFKTWLMFKSSAVNSCWVPLRWFAWQWDADATRGSTLPTQAVVNKIGTETKEFPSWTGTISPRTPYVSN